MSISRFVDVEHDSRLPVWRVSVKLDSPPLDVLNRLRSPWTLSSMFTRWKTVAQPSDDVDIVQYAVNLPALDRTRCFHIIRYKDSPIAFVFCVVFVCIVLVNKDGYFFFLRRITLQVNEY